MFCDLLDEFHGLPVHDYQDEDSWKGPQFAYRLREEYEDEVTNQDRLDSLLEQPKADQLTALIIGTWTGACEGGSSEQTIAALAKIAGRLPNLKHLFLGDITVEECEVSWINQSDISPILKAFPKLISLRVRGGSELSISRVSHDSLQEIAIETGGLSRNVLRQLFLCNFPNLEHLELLLGDEGYGFDGSVEDLQPVLSGRLYPKLTYLGLMNSEITDDIAAVVVNSPIVDRISVLDLSMGNLSDTGIQALHALAGKKNLQKLNIAHHYCSDKAVKELEAALSCEVDASDAQGEDEEFRACMHAE